MDLDIRDAAIEERKSVLESSYPGRRRIAIKFSDHVVGNGDALFAEAARLKLEGIVSKRLGRPYYGPKKPRLAQSQMLTARRVRHRRLHQAGRRAKVFRGTGDRATTIGRGTSSTPAAWERDSMTRLSPRCMQSSRTSFKSNRPFKNLSGSTGQARASHG